MTGPCVGAIDQGTTGTRFVVFDDAGRPIADAFSPLAIYTPQAGWAEHEPMEIWGGTTDAIRRGLRTIDAKASDLSAVAIASQRQTVVVWERDTGDPVGRAISWQDRRTADRVSSLDRDTVNLIRERTGLLPDSYFAAPTIEWMLEHGEAGDGELRERAANGEVLVGTVDSWLLHNLTGRHVTDVTNAAQTMLFDINELEWCEELLDLFDVPRAALPTVRPSSDPEGFGRTPGDGILGAEIPVAGVLGDQQAALVGQFGFTPGDAKITYGAGNFLLVNTDTEPIFDSEGLLTTVWFQRAGDEPLYALEGPIFATGIVLEWLEDVGLVRQPSSIASMARDVDSPAGVTVIPAFAGNGAPFWEFDIAGAVLGLSRSTTPEHIVRACLESIGFATRAAVEAAETAMDTPLGRLHVDGSAVYDDDFVTLQADLLGRRLVRGGVRETAAFGAAIAAGLAIGVWGDDREIDKSHSPEQTFSSSIPRDPIDDRYRSWLEAFDAVSSIGAGGRRP